VGHPGSSLGDGCLEYHHEQRQHRRPKKNVFMQTVKTASLNLTYMVGKRHKAHAKNIKF